MSSAPQRLVGNRLALAGAILYLLEWVGILAFNIGNVPADRGLKTADIVAQYTQHGPGIALLAGWLSVVLLGRILFVAGVRDGLRRSGSETLVADFALAAMAVSVVLEIATYAVTSGGVQAAAVGADSATIVGIDAVANKLNLSILAPLGISVLVISAAMLRSRLFPRLLCWLGLAAGAVIVVNGVIAGMAVDAGGVLYQASQLLQTSVAAFWLWMLITGVVLFRAAGRRPA
jgi:hypothetical protein